MRKNTLKIFYFSGTGNTLYVVSRLIEKLDWLYTPYLYDITFPSNYSKEIMNADCIMIAYPVYGSMPPIPMRQFIDYYSYLFEGKEVMLVVTQRLFSGDGAGYLATKLEDLGAIITDAEHFIMPNNVSDSRVFSVRNGEQLDRCLEKLEKRADKFVARKEAAKSILRGYNANGQFLGSMFNRVWWRMGEKRRRKKLKIDLTLCEGCGLCAKLCPVENIVMQDGKPVPQGGCVFCYRCINSCPQKAIKLFGKRPPQVQYKGIPNFDF